MLPLSMRMSSPSLISTVGLAAVQAVPGRRVGDGAAVLAFLPALPF